MDGQVALKVVGYARVSTEEQAKGGVSIDMQIARIQAWAAAHGHDMAGLHIDAGYSGGDPKRPGLAAAMAEVKACRGVLVFYSLSRWSRGLLHVLGLAHELEAAKASFASITESLDTSTPAGRMIFQVMAVLAEFERGQTRERIKDCLKHKKTQGKRWNCNAPYGFCWVDGKLTAHLDESETVTKVQVMRESGMSLRAIQGVMNDAGYVNRKGGIFTLKQIHNITKGTK